MTTETLTEQIADTKEKIRQENNRIDQLKQQYNKETRKARTRRLIERGAMAESEIPNGESLTNEQYHMLVKIAFSAPNVHEMAKRMYESNTVDTTVAIAEMLTEIPEQADLP